MTLFRPVVPRAARWRPAEGDGLEHLDLAPLPGGGLLASAVVIGGAGADPFALRYRIRLGVDWRVREIAVERTDGRSLGLVSPEPGRWQTIDGAPRPDLDGCIDVDIQATPFTNTLPIRRLGLTRAMGMAELPMVYVPLDTLAPVPDGQRYAALDDGRRYRYEAADESFAAELALDEDGLVLDYPGLFRRVF